MITQIDNLLILHLDEMDDGEIADALTRASDKSKLAIANRMPLHAGMYAEVAAHCASELQRRSPDIHFLSLDRTSEYNIQPEDQPFIERILDVYSYDKNSRTHLCEITPSYWLTSHGSILVFEDFIADNKVRERLLDRYEGIRDEDGGIYVHCHELDAIQKTLEAVPFRYYHLGQPPATRAEYDDDKNFEEAVDEWVAEAYNTGATSIS